MIVRGGRALKDAYDKLVAGDIFIGTVSGKYIKDALLIDLAQRGVYCLPAPLAQKLNSSRTAQAKLLGRFMVPDTRVIDRRTVLMETINAYHRRGIKTVVTKQEHMHCGYGVRYWSDLEMLYNVTALDKNVYPFVIQPFVKDFLDVRVIVVDDYIEVYGRQNKDNFRQNIAVGGRVIPFELNAATERFCKDIMARGRFPFAHIDLMMKNDKKCYLSEIALNGGIKGAVINRADLEAKKKNALEKLAGEIKI
jgi:glutathione synthase/RimK-type ligase-like ATP-grasp enzyme